MIDNEHKLYESRLEAFIIRLKTLIYEEHRDLEVTFCKAGSGLPFEKRLNRTYKIIDKKTVWGENWQRAWFHIVGTIPEDWKGKVVIARINLGGEALVFDAQGLPLCGLSIHTIWPPHVLLRDRIEVSQNAKGGEKVEFWAEGSAGQLFGLFLTQDSAEVGPKQFGSYQAILQYAELAIFRKDLWQLHLDFQILHSLLKALPPKSVRRKRILYTLNQAIDKFQSNREGTAVARKIVKKELGKKATDSDLSTLAVGHAHLDTAWLWPIHETIRKCARTFSSQLALIEKYPAYVFGASQAQHYAFLKEYYPMLYERVRARVIQGRIEIQGGMWIEADCNVIGGESMVRQIVHGKNFFHDEFNLDIKNLWLPDVFGYSAAMPQILRKSGIDFFITQKISWNQFNRFPHHTFIWKGIDGSEVVTHFPPEDNYNSELKPEGLIKARDNFEESTYLDEFLTLFGIGDGGSGPTEEMIESGLRLRDLEGTPRVRFGHAQDMLDRLLKWRDHLPLWNGELYLELHRGTLTTQAYNKKMNRFLELKLREIEMLFSLLPLTVYPSEKIDKIWKKLLLYQFHDIIPGSSITPVYEESRKVYEALSTQTENLVQQAAKLLFKNNARSVTLLNTLSFHYKRPICLPKEWADHQLTGENGQIITSQIEKDGLVIQLDIPPLSAVTLHKASEIHFKQTSIDQKEFTLENNLIRYEFDKNGTISRIFDKILSREVLTEKGKGNLFGYYDDRPVNWDAWDIDIYYEKQLLAHPELLNRKWLAAGPVRQGIQQELKVGHSRIKQEIYLTSNSKRLDFNTRVNWYEDHKMLRVSFEVNIKSDTATYEIQYGHIRRNTHRNTSWDLAKFEVVGHRFADLSDNQYGVALLNNCKYGYKIHENIIDLNLLRSPTNPDPRADRGEHQFVFSLLPHEGDLSTSNVLSEAAQLNQPPALFVGREGSQLRFPVALNTEDVVVEVIKKAEKENVIILRLYEPYGRSTTVRLKFLNYVSEIHETDLLEHAIKKLNHAGNQVQLDFKAFEIKTLKIKS